MSRGPNRSVDLCRQSPAPRARSSPAPAATCRSTAQTAAAPAESWHGRFPCTTHTTNAPRSAGWPASCVLPPSTHHPPTSSLHGLGALRASGDEVVERLCGALERLLIVRQPQLDRLCRPAPQTQTQTRLDPPHRQTRLDLQDWADFHSSSAGPSFDGRCELDHTKPALRTLLPSASPPSLLSPFLPLSALVLSALPLFSPSLPESASSHAFIRGHFAFEPHIPGTGDTRPIPEIARAGAGRGVDRRAADGAETVARATGVRTTLDSPRSDASGPIPTSMRRSRPSATC